MDIDDGIIILRDYGYDLFCCKYRHDIHFGGVLDFVFTYSVWPLHVAGELIVLFNVTHQIRFDYSFY